MEDGKSVQPARQLPTDEAILQATLAILEQAGESKLRVMDIARAVGCSVGILYHHYGDREGLIEAARARQFEGLLESDARALAEAVERCRTAEEFREALHQSSRIGTGPERAELRRRRIGVLGAAWKRPELEEALGRVQNRRTTELQRTIERAQQKGFIRQDVDARAAAAFAQAYTLGRIVSDIDAERPIPDDAWAGMAWRFLQTLLP